jgi:uncharacterized protein
MKPRISVFTLGVADLEQSVAFYRDGLGLPTDGIVGREFEHGAVAFFELSGGVKLAVWAQDDVAHDTGLPRTPISPTSFTIGHNVAGRGEVDAVMAQARRAGAEIVKSPQDTFYGGYAGYSVIRPDTCGRWFGIRPTLQLMTRSSGYFGLRS